MPKIERYDHGDGRERWGFECPGCGWDHILPTSGDVRPRWNFNGSPEAPTFTPSILMRTTEPITDEEADRIMRGEKVDKRPVVCHSFVTDGRIQFLGDCTHTLAGQTIDLPEIEQI
jgi:hypothetical protein